MHTAVKGALCLLALACYANVVEPAKIRKSAVKSVAPAQEPGQEPDGANVTATSFFNGLMDAVRNDLPLLKRWPPPMFRATGLNPGLRPHTTPLRHDRPGYQDEIMSLTRDSNDALAVEFAALPLVEALAHNLLDDGATYTQKGFEVYGEDADWSLKYHLQVATWEAAQEKCAQSYQAQLYGSTHSTQLDDKMATLYPSLRPWIKGDFKEGPNRAPYCPYLSYSQGTEIKFDNCLAQRPFICELFLHEEPAEDLEENGEHYYQARPPRPEHAQPRPEPPRPEPPRPEPPRPEPPRPDEDEDEHEHEHDHDHDREDEDEHHHEHEHDDEHHHEHEHEHEHEHGHEHGHEHEHEHEYEHEHEHEHGHEHDDERRNPEEDGHSKPDAPSHGFTLPPFAESMAPGPEHPRPQREHPKLEVEVKLVDNLKNNLQTLMNIIKSADSDRMHVSPSLLSRPLAVMGEALAKASEQPLTERLAKLSLMERAKFAVQVNAHAMQLRNVAEDASLLGRFLSQDADGQQPLVKRMLELLVELETLGRA